MIGIQSIDINQFLERRSQVSTVPEIPSGIMAGLGDLFADLLPASVSCRISHNQNKETLHVLMEMSLENFSLEEEKQGKKRLFELDFKKSFLQLNHRRAMTEDLSLFSNRLKQWAVYFQSNPISWQTKWKDPSFQKPEDATSLTQLASESLLGLSRKLSSQQSGGNPLDAIRLIRSQLLEILSGQGSKVIITNRKMINPHLNSVYTLEINAETARFEEKGTVMCNLIELDMRSLNLVLNQTPMKATGIQWFVQKLEVLGQDLSKERAEMYRV